MLCFTADVEVSRTFFSRNPEKSVCTFPQITESETHKKKDGSVKLNRFLVYKILNKKGEIGSNCRQAITLIAGDRLEHHNSSNCPQHAQFRVGG